MQEDLFFKWSYFYHLTKVVPHRFWKRQRQYSTDYCLSFKELWL